MEHQTIQSRSTHRAALSGALAVMLGLAAACGSDSPTDRAGSSPDTGAPTTDEVELAQSGGFCADQKITYFVGGDGADSFSSVIKNGAEQAIADTGANVDLIYSDWDIERMVTQLRDAIAAGPDGIAMMGHAGDDSLGPLVEDATAAGILMHYQNVDVPQIRESFGGGFTGSDLYGQAAALANKAIADYGLQPGDQAIVFGAFGDPGREVRDLGVAETFEEYGLEVERIVQPDGSATDPLLMVPTFTAALESARDTKIVVLSGGVYLGVAQQYMEAAGRSPGDPIVIGFDLSDQVLSALEGNWAQLTADQQPYLQGYMPILSLCMQLTHGLSPLNTDTGAGFVTADDASDVAELVEQGVR